MKLAIVILALGCLAHGDGVQDYRDYLKHDIERRQTVIDQMSQPRCHYVYITDQYGNLQTVYVCD